VINVIYNKKYKKTAEAHAAKMRKMGFVCTVYKKKNGYGVSVTRKK